MRWYVGSDLHFSEPPVPGFHSPESLWCSLTINILTLFLRFGESSGANSKVKQDLQTASLFLFLSFSSPPPHMLFILGSPSFSQTLFYRMVRLFLYSPVALEQLEDNQELCIGSPTFFSHLPLVFRPPLHLNFKLSWINPLSLCSNNPLPSIYKAFHFIFFKETNCFLISAYLTLSCWL